MSDKVFFDLIIDEHCYELRDGTPTYILESGGKFNIHRYISLLNTLHIPHSLILDKDENKSYHSVINDYIEKNKSPMTKYVYFFDRDLETFLGILSPKRPDLKPIHIINTYKNGNIEKSKISDTIELIQKAFLLKNK